MRIRTVLIVILAMLGSACQTSKYTFSKKDVHSAQQLYGLELTDKNIDTLYSYLNRNKIAYDSLRSYDLPISVMPAILFDPIPSGFKWPNGDNCYYLPSASNKELPSDNELAFMTVAELGALIKTKKLSSEYLTKLYITRIKKYDPKLKSVISLLEDEAIENAKKADVEIRNGQYKGPLHGIPYGVKDLVSVAGHRTTWGAMPYKDQVIDYTAEIIHRFDQAGAILLAKLTSGALARGDVWWGGKTMNPWDTKQGASGSSAGSGSATAAGLVGFSIGTETLGSITSPSTRNGVTGLRPSYGRVSRDGVMPLSWSMDKVGPICRSAEDCLLVFQAIQGPDVKDPTLYDVPFCYDDEINLSSLRVAYLENLFKKDTTQASEVRMRAVDSLENLGLNFIMDSLPKSFPFAAFDLILRAEAAAFFDELVRSGKTDIMVEQGPRSRANSLRQARFIPAVEYIQANRHRKVLIEEMQAFMSKYDVVVTPTFGGMQLLITNLTGHPVVTFPVGLDEEGHPISLSILGGLFSEAKILKVAKAFQEKYDYDNLHPPMYDGKTIANFIEVIPAHAHNDYESERPLIGAIHKGCLSVEVDVHLIENELYASHNRPQKLKAAHTLENLYLKPLEKLIEANNGVVYNNYDGPFYLMIDVKTGGKESYRKLKEVLAKYRSIISTSSEEGPVSIVISGNRAIESIVNDSEELMVLDGRPIDLEKNYPTSKMPIISQNYKKYLSWDGSRAMKDGEKLKFEALLKATHAQGKMLRLWASPDNETVWEFLLKNGVDIINVDDVSGFRSYYLKKE